MARKFTLKCKYKKALSIPSYLFLCHVCPLSSPVLPYLSYDVKTQRMDMVQCASRFLNTWRSGGEWGPWRTMEALCPPLYVALCIFSSCCWFPLPQGGSPTDFCILTYISKLSIQLHMSSSFLSILLDFLCGQSDHL